MPARAQFVAGRLGVRITYRDGTFVDYPPHARITMDDKPLRSILGRIYRLRPNGNLAYEAPELSNIPPQGFRT